MLGARRSERFKRKLTRHRFEMFRHPCRFQPRTSPWDPKEIGSKSRWVERRGVFSLQQIGVHRIEFTGEVPKRSNGADCKSAGSAFGGSNPPLSTTPYDRWRGHAVSAKRIRGARAGIAQLARARAFQARGRGFESRFPLHARCVDRPM